VIGIFAATHRARFPTLDGLLSDESAGALLLLAHLMWVVSALVEDLHAQNRHEAMLAGDQGLPPNLPRISARALIRDATVRAVELMKRAVPDDPPAAPAAQPGGIGAPGPAPKAAARRTDGLPRWIFRGYKSKHILTAPTRAEHLEKVTGSACLFV
jgi:hypothetical protein